MVTLTLTITSHHKGILSEVESILGHNRIYRKGTDSTLFVDFYRLADAQMMKIALQNIPGVYVDIVNR